MAQARLKYTRAEAAGQQPQGTAASALDGWTPDGAQSFPRAVRQPDHLAADDYRPGAPRMAGRQIRKRMPMMARTIATSATMRRMRMTGWAPACAMVVHPCPVQMEPSAASAWRKAMRMRWATSVGSGPLARASMF